MIRQPSLEFVANSLQKEFNGVNVNYGRQNALNLAAKLQGYKNYAHYKVEAGRTVTATPPEQLAPPVPAAALPATSEPSAREAALEVALQWVVANMESVLSRKPVRDADECLSHAKLLLKQTNQ